MTYDRDGEVVKRFGFHVLGRHSLATYLMDNQENPAMSFGASTRDRDSLVLALSCMLK